MHKRLLVGKMKVIRSSFSGSMILLYYLNPKMILLYENKYQPII